MFLPICNSFFMLQYIILLILLSDLIFIYLIPEYGSVKVQSGHECPKGSKNGSKMRFLEGFNKNLCICTFLLEYESGSGLLTSCKNHMP